MKKIKFLKGATVNDVVHKAGEVIEVPEDIAAAIIAAGDAEEVVAVDEEVVAVAEEREEPKREEPKREEPKREEPKRVYTYKPRSGGNRFEHLSREYNPADVFKQGGSVVYGKREGVDAILSALKGSLYDQCSVINASALGRYQDVLNVDITQVAGKATECALPAGTAPLIYGMALGKYGSKVPLCRDDIEDNDMLVAALQAALRLNLRFGVDAGIVAGSYDAETGGLLGVLDSSLVGEAGVVTNVPVDGDMSAENVSARVQAVVGSLWLPLRPYATLMFSALAWSAYEEFLADNPAKLATIDRANQTIDGMRYHLSPAVPETVGIAAAFMPAYSIRVKRDLLLERCNSCGNDADIFSVSARMTGRLTGKLTGAKLTITPSGD